jgi:hypothetical protein
VTTTTARRGRYALAAIAATAALAITIVAFTLPGALDRAGVPSAGPGGGAGWVAAPHAAQRDRGAVLPALAAPARR